MKDYINEKLDEQDVEWSRPLSERLLKVLFVGAATVFASWASERTFEKACERKRAKQEVEMLEQLLDQ